MKKIGIIGAGGYASVYVNSLLPRHRKQEICLCGVVVRPHDREQRQVQSSIATLTAAGIPIFPDKESLYAEAKPDIVALPIAIGAHCPLAINAVEQGINVIVEKPAAGSVAEVDRMMEAEQRTGKFIAVGFQHIYAPDIRDLKQRLVVGEFGSVKRIAVMGLWPRGDEYYHRNEWVCRLRGSHGEPVYDSPINNAFAHYLNLELFLSSNTFETSSHASEMQAELYRARKNIETFDTCAVRLKTETDAEILTLLSHASKDTVNPILRIETEKGVIEWSESVSWKFTPTDSGQCIVGGPASDGRKNMFSLLIQKAEGQKVFTCPLSVAKEHTFCIENLHKFFTVSEISGKEYDINTGNGIFEIYNIKQDFQKCFERFQLPSEYGVRWAIPSKAVKLS